MRIIAFSLSNVKGHGFMGTLPTIDYLIHLPFIDPILTILPFEFLIIGKNFLVTYMLPKTLTLIILSISLFAIISGVPTKHTPALFTNPHNSKSIVKLQINLD